jgi:hypothetical protein
METLRVADDIIDLTIDWERGTIAQKLARLPEDMKESAMQAIDEGADFIVSMAKTYVLVDTGTLQKSIRKQRTKDNVVSVRAGGFYVNPKTRRLCDYAHWVELHYPYMRPAVDTARRYITNLIREKVVVSVNE